MITPTTNDRWLRVRLDNFYVSPTTRANVHCYLEITDLGLVIHYSHHEFLKRPVDKGAWVLDKCYPVPLNPALEDLIYTTIMTEFWSHFCPHVPIQTVDRQHLREALEVRGALEVEVSNA